MSEPAIGGRAACAYAPGGIGNLGPGLDILGCALAGAGDIVEAMTTDTPGIRIDDPGHPDLTTDPARHASAIAAAAVLRLAGVSGQGFALRVRKGLPLSGGQGGSAASAVAGALAANALIGSPLSTSDLLRAALVSEERLAGRHLDNLAPALLGGIVLIRSVEPPLVVRLPVPDNLFAVVVHPAMRVNTADARAVLPASVDRAIAIGQAAAVAAMVAAFVMRDLSLLRGAIDDRIAEPARATLLPGFPAAKQAALDAGALGCSISGAGPSSFALADDRANADHVLRAMCAAYERSGLHATGRVTTIDERGAHVETIAPW